MLKIYIIPGQKFKRFKVFIASEPKLLSGRHMKRMSWLQNSSRRSEGKTIGAKFARPKESAKLASEFFKWPNDPAWLGLRLGRHEIRQEGRRVKYLSNEAEFSKLRPWKCDRLMVSQIAISLKRALAT